MSISPVTSASLYLVAQTKQPTPVTHNKNVVGQTSRQPKRADAAESAPTPGHLNIKA